GHPVILRESAPRCEGSHSGTNFHILDIVAVRFLSLRAHGRQKAGLDMLKRLLVTGAAAASIIVGGCAGVGAASADPAVWGGPGTPPCAPPLSPEQQCALVAWRTWTPCNWVGVQVPVGTPG